MFFKPACRMHSDTNTFVAALGDFSYRTCTELHRAFWKFFAEVAHARGQSCINGHEHYLTAQTTALRAAGSDRTTKQNKHAVSLRQGQTRFSGKRNPDRAQRHFEILQTVHCSFTVAVPPSKPLPPLSTLSVAKDTTTLTKPSGSPSPQRVPRMPKT